MRTSSRVIEGGPAMMGNNLHNIKGIRTKQVSQVLMVDICQENPEVSEGGIIQDIPGVESLNSIDNSINNGINQINLEEGGRKESP